MKILVLGATGNIGKRIVTLLRQKQHEVIAFAHRTSYDFDSPITVIKGSIYNRTDLARAAEGVNTVISCLGSWRSPKKDILSSAMQNLIPICKEKKIRRIISLTGADAHLPNEFISRSKTFLHAVFSLLAPQIMNDSEKHMEILLSSQLEWTVLRAPVMTNRTSVQGPSINFIAPSILETVSRDDVAQALVTIAEKNSFTCAAPFVHSLLRSKNDSRS